MKLSKLSPVLLCILLIFNVIGSNYALAQPFKKGDDFRLGIHMGLNVTRLTGSELQSPTNKVGMAIGASYRQKLNDNLHLNTDITFSLRGSNFDFEEENFYYAMKYVYLDMPVTLMFNTTGSKENGFITAGLQPSYLLQSEIYVNPDFRARYRNFGFKRWDVAAVVGYHFDFYYFGIEPSLKFGLLNINDNISMPEVFPATGNNGSIRNVTFDLAVYF